jgi:hypothetical protein
MKFKYILLCATIINVWAKTCITFIKKENGTELEGGTTECDNFDVKILELKSENCKPEECSATYKCQVESYSNSSVFCSNLEPNQRSKIRKFRFLEKACYTYWCFLSSIGIGGCISKGCRCSWANNCY